LGFNQCNEWQATVTVTVTAYLLATLKHMISDSELRGRREGFSLTHFFWCFSGFHQAYHHFGSFVTEKVKHATVSVIIEP
jgi:hypothetical protein